MRLHIETLIFAGAIACTSAGCRGPLYVHEENYYSIGMTHTRYNDPRVANEVSGVSAKASATIGSNNKAIAK